MIRRIALTVLAFAVLAGLTVGVSLIAPERRPASAAVELPRTSSVTCGVAGEVFAVADSAFAARDLSGAAGPVGVSPFAAPLEGPTVLTTDGRSVAGILTANLGDRATKVPTRKMPDWLLKLFALVRPELKQLVAELGHEVLQAEREG